MREQETPVTLVRPGRGAAAARARWSTLVLLVLSRSAGADEVRDFNADTPGKSYTPYTVAQGYLQLESDIFHIVDMDGARLIESLDPILKYGLTDDVEVEVQTGGMLNMTYRVDGRIVRLTGYGDTTPAVKWGVFGNDWQVFSLAIRGGIKIPTASPQFGNGAVEYFFDVPAQLALPYDLSIQVQEEIDLLKNQNDTGKHLEYSEIFSVARSFGKTTVTGELFAQSGTDANSHALYTADIGVGYAITPTAVLSLGTYFGLNRHAPGVEAYTAFAFRF